MPRTGNLVAQDFSLGQRPNFHRFGPSAEEGCALFVQPCDSPKRYEVFISASAPLFVADHTFERAELILRQIIPTSSPFRTWATMLFLGNFWGSFGGLCSGRPLATRGRFLLHPTVLAALLELLLRNQAVSVRIDHREVHDKWASLTLRQNLTLSFGHVPNAVAFSFI